MTLVAGTVGAGYSLGRQGTRGEGSPGTNDDLRAAYANAADVADGKRIAESTCAACHGANGISGIQGVPHLAGQRPAYLYTELRAYQSGARNDTTMGNTVKPLNDSALVKVAAYYASLEPAQPATARCQAGARPGRSGPGRKDRRGRLCRLPRRNRRQQDAGNAEPRRARSAISGRGDEGVQERPAQERHDEVDDAPRSPMPDLNNIALYLRAAKACAGGRRRQPAIAAAGKAASAACAGCHGDKGVSANPAIPSLAGQDAQYLVAALHAYKDGSRGDETMKGLAASLDEPPRRTSRPFTRVCQPQPTNVRKPLTTAEWAQRCDRCHGVNGNSTDPRLPALAAQRVDYLRKGAACLPHRRAQESADGCHVGRADRSGRRESRRVLCAPEGACRRYIHRAARKVAAATDADDGDQPDRLRRGITNESVLLMARTLRTVRHRRRRASCGRAQAGKAKAAACAGCHGANGEGKNPTRPWPARARAEIAQALQDYKSGKRANPIMKSFATPLSDQDMANLAAYYASLK